MSLKFDMQHSHGLNLPNTCVHRMDPPPAEGEAQGRGNAAAERRHQERIQSQRDEFADLRGVTLNADQEKVIRDLMESLSGLHCLSGPPGSGKSFTIKVLTDRLRAGHKIVVLTATTGCAAVRLSVFAQTAHTCFSLPFENGKLVMPLNPANPKFAILNNADVFIVDEYSMLTCQVKYLKCR